MVNKNAVAGSESNPVEGAVPEKPLVYNELRKLAAQKLVQEKPGHAAGCS